MDTITLYSRKRLFIGAWILLLVCGRFGLSSLADAPPALGEAQLIEKVMAGQMTPGFVTTAQLDHVQTNGEKQLKRLIIKGRRNAETSEYLFRLVWPRDQRGEGWLLKRAVDGRWGGYHFTPPDQLQELNTGILRTAFFDTNLTLFDLTSDYWKWPNHRFIGEETIQRRVCKILESKPAENAVNPLYGTIRTWIALEGFAPMKVEMYGANDNLVKTIRSEKLLRINETYWTPSKLLIVDATSGDETTLSGTRSDRDVKLEDSVFTLDALRNPGE